MKNSLTLVASLFVIWPVAQSARAAEPALIAEPVSSATAEGNEWFEREVRPLLAERCLSCHSSGLEAPKANLKLDRRESMLAGGDSGPALVPGKPDESLLIKAVRGEALQMPPDKPLTKQEQTLLQRWIELGAPWPDRKIATPASGPEWLKIRTQSHWAWQAMRDSLPPGVSNPSWPARPLDAFVHSKLDRISLEPSAAANRTQLLRRLTFDLTGLPPTAEHMASYAAGANDNSAQLLSPSDEERYAALIEELLASPQFGVTWGRHWFDLVRYCETLGHEFDYPLRHAWRYRDAVIDSINTDISYATFVQEHIAGDLVESPRRHALDHVNQSLALTGWWWMGEGLHAPVDVWGDEAARLDNQIDVYSKAFLGLTIACARCHDHKFDAISAADYTSLVGVLQSSRRTYSLDDPRGAIAAHNRTMAEKTRELIEPLVRATGHERTLSGISRPASSGPLVQTQPEGKQELGRDLEAFRAWVAQMVEHLRQKPDEAREAYSPHHPLYPLQLLAQSGSAEDFSKQCQAARGSLKSAAEAFTLWQSSSVLLADFSRGLPEGWYVEAADPQLAELAVRPFNILPLDPLAPLPSRPGCFTSLSLGKQQQLALRSPTFMLTHPLVAMRLRGKSVQSSIVVDNYFMNEFQGLLFGDMRKPIDQPHDAGYVVHGGDLNKYIGHPAYVSLEDDENAWFEISEVRLCQTPPPTPGNNLTIALLDAAITPGSPEQLSNEFATMLHRSWQRSVGCHPAEPGSVGLEGRGGRGNTADQEDGPRVELLRSALIEGQRHNMPLPIAALQSLDRQPLESLAARTPAPVRILAIHEGTPRNAALAIRGNPHARGDLILRGQLQALGGRLFDKPTSSGRAEMAADLTSGQHPLTARVAVNRVWLQLFGQGLVDSPDNFGLLGGAPSNVELLDYLSQRFIEHDWSVKWLVREICLSRTYRLASQSSDEQRERDPTARFLSHRRVRRLSAEKLRDAMLSISGSLDNTHGGESVRVHLTDQMSGRGRPERSGPLDGAGRRSAYVEIRRNFLDPFLIDFDLPAPATTVGKRNLSNVPAQALSMLNDPLVHEVSRRWSRRAAAGHASTEEQITSMYAAAFARSPTATELAACRQMIDEPLGLAERSIDFQSSGEAAGESSAEAKQVDRQRSADRLTQLAHVLLCTKEFQYLQ